MVLKGRKALVTVDVKVVDRADVVLREANIAVYVFTHMYTCSFELCSSLNRIHSDRLGQSLPSQTHG